MAHSPAAGWLVATRAHTHAQLQTRATADSELARRDASVKKNAALTRKLRGVTEEARGQLLADIARSNLSKVCARMCLCVCWLV